jgi:hypothetical protein
VDQDRRFGNRDHLNLVLLCHLHLETLLDHHDAQEAWMEQLEPNANPHDHERLHHGHSLSVSVLSHSK